MKYYTLDILEEGTGFPQASAQFTVPNMKHYTLDILEEGTGFPQASAQYTVPNISQLQHLKITYLYLRDPLDKTFCIFFHFSLICS